LAVPVELPAPYPAELTARFHALHAARYGNARPDDPVQAVTYRLRASHPVPSLSVPSPPASGEPTPEYADATLDGGPTRVPFYDRATLPAGWQTAGPCVIEEPTATTFVAEGWTMRVDEQGCLHLQR
jgi:N-methylhydantoinase A